MYICFATIYIRGDFTLDDINVQLLNMDTKIPEQLVKNEDDSYTIFLNTKLSHENQLKSYYHALRHIQEQDFEKEDADKIEHQAHYVEFSTELGLN